MGAGDDDGHAQIRMGELLGAVSLGIDLGFGQPMAHVLRQCRIALRLGDLLDIRDEDKSAVYYSALLVNIGCHTDAFEQARWFGDDIALKATKYDHEPFSLADVAAMVGLIGSGCAPLHRLRVGVDLLLSGRKDLDGMIARHARMARRLGEELGLAAPVLSALGSSYERWDGRGWPGELAGAEIPQTSRIVQLAEFLEVAHRRGGIDAARSLAERRSGTQFDPALCGLVLVDAPKIFHGLDEDPWGSVVDYPPVLDTALTPQAM